MHVSAVTRTANATYLTHNPTANATYSMQVQEMDHMYELVSDENTRLLVNWTDWIQDTPSLHHHCTTTAPSLHHHCTITAPSPHHPRIQDKPFWSAVLGCSITMVHRHCTITAPSLHHHCAITEPSLHHHCVRRRGSFSMPTMTGTVTAPSLHRHCTITAPSLHHHCARHGGRPRRFPSATYRWPDCLRKSSQNAEKR